MKIMQATYYNPDTGEILGNISGPEDSLWFWLLGTEYEMVEGVYDASAYYIDIATGHPKKRGVDGPGPPPKQDIPAMPSFPQ